jgi:UDP-N-acetylglucosamine 2-epimerase (non-hydrolysing)/GDP/UDP-N,N'-diacetylbacillosamine 2-epimerase (hydrolysing)
LFATAQAIGSGVLAVSKELRRIQPDIMVVYADRFEGFAAVIAATQMNIPTAHIEGGDLTEGGALDDSVRHAMTKLAHLHFTTNTQASNRILAMGEEPWRVHTVGFPAIDLIAEGNYASSEEVFQRLNLNPTRPVVLFTQHSVTTEFEKACEQVTPSLQALEKLASEGVQVILTYPNNDAGGRGIIEKLIEFESNHYEFTQVRRSLGRHLYHGLLALARDDKHRIVCLGNSSSGLKETPAFGCPTVNIGSRQDGRLRGENVIDAGYSAEEIYDAVKIALFDEDFRKTCREAINPYWLGEAGPKIANVLANIPLGQEIIRKLFTLKGETKDGWYR